MNIWGITKKYKRLSWSANFLSGHWNIGKKITIFGENAMDWFVEIQTKRLGYICFTLPTLRRFKNNSLHMYLSPNATPWAATFYVGFDKHEKIRARIRRLNFGHGFSTNKHYEALCCLNDKFDSLIINDYDIEQQNSEVV